MSVEGTARAVKPWSSFQCTGIRHAVRARTYKGDEHLAYALNKSMAPVAGAGVGCLLKGCLDLTHWEWVALNDAQHFPAFPRRYHEIFVEVPVGWYIEEPHPLLVGRYAP